MINNRRATVLTLMSPLFLAQFDKFKHKIDLLLLRIKENNFIQLPSDVALNKLNDQQRLNELFGSNSGPQNVFT